MYVGHNLAFLAYSAAMEGRKAETLEAIKKLRAAALATLVAAVAQEDKLHKSAEAAAVESKFHEAWRHADVTLSSSAL